MAQQEEQQKQKSPVQTSTDMVQMGMKMKGKSALARMGAQLAARAAAALAPAAAAAAPFIAIAIGAVVVVILFIVVILVAIGVIGGGSVAGASGGGLGLNDTYCQSYRSPEDLDGDGEFEDCSTVLRGIILQAAAAAKMPAGVLIGIGFKENITDIMVLPEAEITQYSQEGAVLPDAGVGEDSTGKCATSPASPAARGPMQFQPPTFDGHKTFIIDAGVRPDGYEPKICNIMDNIYAAAHKLKSDSGIPFDEEARPWTDGEVVLAASYYHFGSPRTHRECDTSNNYCSKVLEYYENKKDQGVSGDPNVPSGCPLRSGLIEGPGNLYGAPRSYGGHSGVDLQGGDGAEVLATMNGLVEFSGFDPSAGYMVKIGNGPYKTRYLHMYSDLRVSNDEQVLRGTVLGRQDDSGTSSEGSHLHYDVFENGDTVDPTPFIPMENVVGATCEA